MLPDLKCTRVDDSLTRLVTKHQRVMDLLYQGLAEDRRVGLGPCAAAHASLCALDWSVRVILRALAMLAKVLDQPGCICEELGALTVEGVMDLADQPKPTLIEFHAVDTL